MEYELEFIIKFKCDKKNLETVNDIRSLGSSITSMEMCMILEDKLKELNLKDEMIKKISYNFNRSDKITLIIQFTSLKRLTKYYLECTKDEFLNSMNKYFKENSIHKFRNKNQELKEVYVILK